MKKIILLVFASLSLISLKSFCQNKQSAYYDAIFIKQNCYSVEDTLLTNQTDLIAVLMKYYPDISATNLINILNENPFFKNITPDAFAASPTPLTFLNNAVNSASGLDVTNIANGLADLLIDRAKQELTVAVFERFKKFASENPEFQILFPKTTANLTNLLTISYPQMLQALRAGFLDDLKQIPYNIDDVLELPKYRLLLNKFPEVTVAIRSIKLIHELESGASNPADLIKEFALFPEWGTSGSIGFDNMANTIKFASLFSESLRSNDSTKIWVSSVDIKNLISDNVTFTIFMGLLYQEIVNADVKFYVDASNTPKTLKDILDGQTSNVFLFQTKISEFINLTDKVALSYNSIKKSKDDGKKLADSDIYNYIDVSLNAVDYTLSVVKIFDPSLTADKYLSIARKTNSLYKDVYSKQYTAVINDAVDFLQEVHDLTKSNNNAANIAVPTNSLNENDGLGNMLTFVQKVKPYALLMANLVEAKTSKDVQTALENAILPVGSYTIKQKSVFNISLNGYIGYALDFNTVGFDKLYANGFYAPVGFSFTFNLTSILNPSSTRPLTYFFTPTIMLSVIDVGSVVSYKLSNDNTPSGSTTSMSQQIKLESIFSPSVQLLLGIRGTPITIGAGWRRTPSLFYSGNGTYTTISARDVFNVTALIDIPFFTLHNKQFNQ